MGLEAGAAGTISAARRAYASAAALFSGASSARLKQPKGRTEGRAGGKADRETGRGRGGGPPYPATVHQSPPVPAGVVRLVLTVDGAVPTCPCDAC